MSLVRSQYSSLGRPEISHFCCFDIPVYFSSCVNRKLTKFLDLYYHTHLGGMSQALQRHTTESSTAAPSTAKPSTGAQSTDDPNTADTV